MTTSPKNPILTQQLYEAIQENDFKKTENLLFTQKVDPNDYIQDFLHPVNVAVAQGKKPVIELLIQAGADLNILDAYESKNWNPLWLAIGGADYDLVEWLIECGSAINFSMPDGLLPIHYAAFLGNSRMVKLLLSRGADVNGKNQENNSPLHLVAESGNIEMLQFLLGAGADPFLKNAQGFYPIFLAGLNDQYKVMRTLLDEGLYGSKVVSSSIKSQYSEADEKCRKVANERLSVGMEHHRNIAERFRRLSAKYPKFWKAHYGLGEVLSVIANNEKITSGPLVEEKIEALNTACLLAPNAREPKLKLAAEYAKRNIETAEKLYREAILDCSSSKNYLYGVEMQAGDYFEIGIQAANSSGFGNTSFSLDAFCRAILINPDYYAKTVMPNSRPAQLVWRSAIKILPELRNEEQLGETEEFSSGFLYRNNKAVDLHNLAGDLFEIYTRNPKDMDYLLSAMGKAEEALSLMEEDYTRRNKTLRLLGQLYRVKFQTEGDPEDLEKASLYYRKALESTPKTDRDYMNYLQDHGTMLYTVGINTFQKELIEESIVVLKKVVNLQTDPQYFVHHYGNLGLSRMALFKMTGSIEQLNQAIEEFEQAKNYAAPYSIEYTGAQTNFGIGLRNLYKIFGEQVHLEMALEAFKEAIEYTPVDSIHYPARLINMANGLVMDSKNYGSDKEKSREKLEEALGYYETAIDNTNESSPAYLKRLSGKVNVLSQLYDINSNLQYLDQSIALSEIILQGAQKDDFDISSFHLQLAIALSKRYERNSKTADLNRAMERFEKAIVAGAKDNLSNALTAGATWMNWALDRKSWVEVKLAYQGIREPIGRLIKTQLFRREKEAWLKEMQGLAKKAAFALIQLGGMENIHKAVEVLEEGLGRQMRETLSLNNFDLEELNRQGHTGLYQTFVESTEYVRHLYQQEDLQSEIFTQLQQAFRQLDKAVSEIRQIEGFENFFHSLSVKELFSLSQENPIAYVFSTEQGGMILAVEGRKQKVTPIPLGQLNNKVLSKCLSGFIAFQSGDSTRTTDSVKGLALLNQEDPLNHTLHALWDYIMKDLVNYFRGEARVTLIPVGLLSVLPLHAAKCRTDQENSEEEKYALDFLEFNYAPNAQALNNASNCLQNDHILIIDEPLNSLSKLPASRFESLAISCFFKERKILSRGQATVTAVQSALEEQNVVSHFSCHGEAFLGSPLSSYLAMANDGPLSLESLLNQNLEKRLIALSACETGVIGANLPEEALSLASCFLQAGTSAVLGSLWKVYDFSTMLLMVKFYDLWKRSEKNPIAAFCEAVKWLKDSSSEIKRDYLTELYGLITRQFPAINDPDLEMNYQNWMDWLNKEGEKLQWSNPDHWAAFIFMGL